MVKSRTTHALPFFTVVAVVLSIGACYDRAGHAGQETCRRQALPHVPPSEVGMDRKRLGEIDRIVTEGIRAGQMAGCVVAVGRHGKLVYLKAFGHRQLEPEKRPMTVDTLFDLASLTKPIATATSVMILAQQGKIELCAPVARYLPQFGRNGKEKITVFQLLTHQGGLVADNSLSDYAHGVKTAWERIFALPLHYPPGERFVYTDVGYMVLGRMVEQVSGERLDRFAQRHIFAPLGMCETGFLPGPALRQRAAATEKRNGRWMVGQVHDPRAYRLGGVAGHAGLFSTAEDLAVFAQMMLGRGAYRGVRVLRPQWVDRMTRPYATPRGFRGLGWDVQSGYSSNRSKLYSPEAFGHGGFTGTAIWIDPVYDLLVVFLSNRLHPDGKGTVNPIVGRVGTVAVEAIDPAPHRPVLTGIDVLEQDGFDLLRGSHVGLITNHTGVDRRGISTARLLHDAPEVELVALFSPEHGIEGVLDTSRIGHGRHRELNVPVWSLYGTTRRPTAEMLRGIDTLVFDIQDIGTRFYTYISTMGYAMEEAAKRRLRFIVLDRPNPIGGVAVEGPVLDPGRESFVGYHAIAVRHGMTTGELALLFNAERHMKLDLHVVRMRNWRRELYWEQTGLRWINPSPNMRSVTEALLYPGIGLLETTNLSVGRGTATPFEWIGAPWIDGRSLANSLRKAGLEGIEFRAVSFTPEASVYAGKRCEGVGFRVTDRVKFRPLRTGLELARQLRLQYPDRWDGARYDRLLADRAVFEAVLAARPVDEIEHLYQAELESFVRRRRNFLLYLPASSGADE